MPTPSVVTCSSTGRWGRTPPGCRSPTPTRRSGPGSPTSTTTSSADTSSPATAGIQAGFHVIGDAAAASVAAAFGEVADELGTRHWPGAPTGSNTPR